MSREDGIFTHDLEARICNVTGKSNPTGYVWTNRAFKGVFNACVMCCPNGEGHKSLQELNDERKAQSKQRKPTNRTSGAVQPTQ